MDIFVPLSNTILKFEDALWMFVIKQYFICWDKVHVYSIEKRRRRSRSNWIMEKAVEFSTVSMYKNVATLILKRQSITRKSASLDIRH